MTAITVKVHEEEKLQYQKICKENDITMSQAIRKFIRSEIEKYNKKNK